MPEMGEAARFAAGIGFQPRDQTSGLLSTDPISRTREQVFGRGRRAVTETSEYRKAVLTASSLERDEQREPGRRLAALTVDQQGAPSFDMRSLSMSGPQQMSSPSSPSEQSGPGRYSGPPRQAELPREEQQLPPVQENHYHFSTNSYYPTSFNDTIRRDRGVQAQLRYGAVAHRTNRRNR